MTPASTRKPSGRRRLHRSLAISIGLALVGLTGMGAAGLVATGHSPLAVTAIMHEHPTNAWIRHAGQWLEGHPALELVALPLLDRRQAYIEPPAPPSTDTLGNGRQFVTADVVALGGRVMQVESISSLERTMAAPREGNVVELAPGDYVDTQPLGAVHPGTAE